MVPERNPSLLRARGLFITLLGVATFLRAPGGEKEVGRWSLVDLTPAPGYAACLAVEGAAEVVCWEWQGPDRKAEAQP